MTHWSMEESKVEWLEQSEEVQTYLAKTSGRMAFYTQFWFMSSLEREVVAMVINDLFEEEDERLDGSQLLNVVYSVGTTGIPGERSVKDIVAERRASLN